MKEFDSKGFVYEFGKFTLDPRERTLFVDGVAVHLPAKEFDTLLLLIEHNGHALSKEEMMAAIWQDAFVEEGNLVKQISRLRKLFNTNGNKFIETIPKHGYRFVAEMQLVELDAAQPVIAEKRTVQRLRFAVADHIRPERLALPPARIPFYRSPWFALTIAALIGLTYLTLNYGRTLFTADSAPVDPYAPVRLTDNPLDDTGPQWSKDGRIRFSRFYSSDRIETWIMNADGTSQSAVPMSDGKRIFSWSPDEKKVLFQKGDIKETFLSNVDGSGETLLPFRSGVWSADSKLLVYHQKLSGDNFDIFVYDIETRKIRNLTNSETFDADPSFSPDGKQVVFTSIRDGNGEICSIDLDGNNLRRLTFNNRTDNHPAFSPDGTQILFTSDREYENADVYLMNADGSNQTKLTHFDKSNETAGPGGWSPDGTKIAFFSDRNGKDDIYVISAESVRPKQILSDEHDVLNFSHSPDGKKIAYSVSLEDRSGELRTLDLETAQTSLLKKTELATTAPSWSPDGNWIVYTDRINGNSEVCVIKPDGGNMQNLTNDPAQDSGPSWSPDGKSLAFVTTRGGSGIAPRLYRMNADGSDPRPITPRNGWEGEPIWSPDGQKIIFACDRVDSPGNAIDICQVNIDGTEERRIIFHPDHDSHPSVSTSGRIAFTATSDGNYEIYLVNPDGTGLLRITRNTADDQAPEWSSDGTKLFFISNRDGRFAIYEVEVPQ